MKKLILFMVISLGLQGIYYLIFLSDAYMQYNYQYNLLSFISLAILLGWYIKKTSFILKYGIKHLIHQVIIGLGIVIMLLSFMFFFGFFGSYGMQVLYFYFTNLKSYITFEPLFLQVWDHHLITYQMILFILNIFVDITETSNENMKKLFKKIYLILSILIVLFIPLMMLIDLNGIFLHTLFIITMLIYWLFIPLFFLLCEPFRHYYAVLIGWFVTTYYMWPFFRALFDIIYNIPGYTLTK